MGTTLRIFASLAILFFFATSPHSSLACSVVGCVGDGVESRSNLIIRIAHAGKPLPGVTVQIAGEGGQIFSGITQADGAVHISGLKPGDYWLHAELLGIYAGSTCFHVNPRASKKARKQLKFDWGGEPSAISRIAGRLEISELGKEGDLVYRLRHRINLPIRNASLILRSPFTDAVYRRVSDQDGAFLFSDVPPGIYVLHVEGGEPPSGEVFGSDDFLLNLAASASAKKLVLTPDVGGGSCGGWSLALESK